MLIRSAEPNIGKQEKLKLYREPLDEESSNSNALDKLREYKQRAMLLAYGAGAHDSQTPIKKEADRPLFLISHQNSQKVLLPSISSTKAVDIGKSVQHPPLPKPRYLGRNPDDFSSRLSVPENNV